MCAKRRTWLNHEPDMQYSRVVRGPASGHPRLENNPKHDARREAHPADTNEARCASLHPLIRVLSR